MRYLRKFFVNNFSISLIITIAVLTLFSIVSGFNYTYRSNDDYMISMLLSNGDNKIIFSSYFLTYWLAILQKVFPNINFFTASQQILCLLSSTVFGYFFLNNFGKLKGAFLTIFTSCCICITSIIMVQYTQTTTVVCLAGFVLLLDVYSSKAKTSLRVFKYIIGIILFLVGSLYRIESFNVLTIFVLVTTVFVAFYNQDTDKNIKSFTFLKIFRINKISLHFICLVGLLISLVLGLNISSDVLKSADSNYIKHKDLGVGRQMVTDYPVAPFEGNESFYKSIGVLSPEEITLASSGYIDTDTMTAEKLVSIGTYSKQIRQNNSSDVNFVINRNIKKLLSAAKDIYRKTLNLVSKSSFNLNNQQLKVALFIIAASIVILSCFLLLLLVKKINNKSQLFLWLFKVFIFLCWCIFFWLYKINKTDILMVVFFSAIVFILIFANFKNTILCFIFSLLPILIYCYQIQFRLNFHAVFTVVLPSMVLLLCLLDYAVFKLPSKINLKKFLLCILSVLCLFSVFFSYTYLWSNLYVIRTTTYTSNLKNYCEEHPDQTILHTISMNPFLDQGYHNTLLVPQNQANTLIFGSWCISSNYYNNQLYKKSVKNLFEDIIDNKNFVLALDLNSTFDIIETYNNYLTKQYGDESHTIALIEVETIREIGCQWGGTTELHDIGLYRVVSVANKT